MRPFLAWLIVSLIACSRGGQEAEAGIIVAKAVADETRYAREGRPRGSLAEGATPQCPVFADYVTGCPSVPTCDQVRAAHEPLQLNVCTNERGALERVVLCGSARNENEARCTSASFLSCERLAGAVCDIDLALCDSGHFELAVAQCCVDKARCRPGTFVLLPRRPQP